MLKLHYHHVYHLVQNYCCLRYLSLTIPCIGFYKPITHLVMLQIKGNDFTPLNSSCFGHERLITANDEISRDSEDPVHLTEKPQNSKHSIVYDDSGNLTLVSKQHSDYKISN